MGRHCKLDSRWVLHVTSENESHHFTVNKYLQLLLTKCYHEKIISTKVSVLLIEGPSKLNRVPLTHRLKNGHTSSL